MPAFVARYASAFADVVTAARLSTAAIDGRFAGFLATWDSSSELRTFFINPAIPAAQKIAILDKLNVKLLYLTVKTSTSNITIYSVITIVDKLLNQRTFPTSIDSHYYNNMFTHEIPSCSLTD